MPPAAAPAAAATGGCACGAVRYRLPVERRAALCHCETCRRASGAAGIAWANGDRAALVVDGEPATWRSSDHASRQHCARCGSPLFCLEDDAPAIVEVAAGTLDDPGHVTEVTHSDAHARPAWDLPRP